MFLTPLPLANGWSFDWRSALIGAGGAWLIALILYLRRERVRSQLRNLWSPVARWRERMRRSVAEKYFTVLQQSLSKLLLFEPEKPTAIFVPPILLAPPPLPTTLIEKPEFDSQPIAYEQLLAGHPHLLLIGKRGQGRTTALALLAWQIAHKTGNSIPYTHFPLWIDLNKILELPTDAEMDPIEYLTELAVEFLPQARPQWLQKQLLNMPSLILVDNWEDVPLEARAEVAHVITTAAKELPASRWIITANAKGIAPLTEAGFVPIEIEPQLDESAISTIYSGWAIMLDHEEQELAGAFKATLQHALERGDSQLDFHLRTMLYLREGLSPERPIAVIQALLEDLLPTPQLAEEEYEVAQTAERITSEILEKMAWQLKSDEQQQFTPAGVESLLAELLPPPAERPPKLERTVHKSLAETELLSWNKEQITFRHYVWEDFFAARRCSQQLELQPELLAHLQDHMWALTEEYYLGLGNAQALVREQLQASLTSEDQQELLMVARWATLAPPEAKWRKTVMKVLAQTFTKPELSLKARLEIGRALTLIAGESARAFFLQALRHRLPAVRTASLRGLGWTGTPKEMRILAGGLKGKDFATRESAVRALGDLGTPGSLRLLKDQLPLADEDLLLIMAETLAIHPSGGGEILKQALKSEDLLIRRAAVHGLGKLKAAWATKLLEQVQREDAQWLVRSAAEAALSEAEVGEGNQATISAPPQMDKAQWLINWAAEQGLGVGVGEAAMQLLLRVLEIGEPEAQVLAAASLAQIGHKEHLATLQKLANHPEEDVKIAVNHAIQQIELRYAGLPPED